MVAHVKLIEISKLVAPVAEQCPSWHNLFSNVFMLTIAVTHFYENRRLKPSLSPPLVSMKTV